MPCDRGVARTRQGAGPIALKALLWGLFGVAVWFRVTSLEAMPDVESDEAWYGIQAYRLGHGQPFEFQTPNCNPLNPLHTGLEVPLLWVFPPAYWILRAPAVIAGLATIALTYSLGARAFGRRPALIASALVAVLPITILYSRKGYDCSPTPLMSLLLLYFAWEERWKGMLLAALGCFLCHPTNLFLLPVAATVYFVRAWLRLSGDARGRRLLVARTGICALLVVIAGVLVLLRPRTQLIISVFHYGGLSRRLFLKEGGGLAGSELAEFATLFAQLFLGCGSFGLAPGLPQVRAFWGVFLAVLVAGSVGLARRRQWDRLAVVVGALLGALALFLVVGASALRLDANRYGLFLVMPTILAFALLADPLIVAPTTRLRAAALHVQCAAMLVMAGALLLDFKTLCFDAQRGGSREERVWTFRTDARDPKKRAMRLIEHELDRANARRARAGQGPGRTVLYVDDWWTWKTFEYLAVDRPDVEVRFAPLDGLSGDAFERRWAEIRGDLDAGSYAVGFKGKGFDHHLHAHLAPDRLRSWELPRYANMPVPFPFCEPIMVFRARRPSEVGPPPLMAERQVERR